MKKNLFIVALFFSLFSVAQTNINFSDAKGINDIVTPLGDGFIVKSDFGLKKTQFTYFNDGGKKAWEYSVLPFNYNNVVLTGTNYVFHINLSYAPTATIEKSNEENPILVTRLDTKGNMTSSGNKIKNFFKEFEGYSKKNGVYRENIFISNDNIFMLFECEQEGQNSYYLCKIDQDFKTIVKKLSFNSTEKDINDRIISEPRLINFNETTATFTQMYNNEGELSFKTIDVELESFEENTIFEKTSIPSENVSGYGGFQGNIAINMSYRCDYLKQNDWSNTIFKGNTTYIVPTLNDLFDCKIINDNYYYYGFHITDKKVDGVWVYSIKKESTTGEMRVIKYSKDELEEEPYTTLNLFELDDEVILTATMNEFAYTFMIDKKNIKKVSVDFIEENTNPLFNLALFIDKKVTKSVCIKNGLIYLMTENEDHVVNIKKY